MGIGSGLWSTGLITPHRPPALNAFGPNSRRSGPPPRFGGGGGEGPWAIEGDTPSRNGPHQPCAGKERRQCPGCDRHDDGHGWPSPQQQKCGEKRPDEPGPGQKWVPAPLKFDPALRASLPGRAQWPPLGLDRDRGEATPAKVGTAAGAMMVHGIFLPVSRGKYRTGCEPRRTGFMWSPGDPHGPGPRHLPGGAAPGERQLQGG
jgi:hypothetical protein